MAILVVDDDPDTRARLDRSLREFGDGWDVRHAASAAEALGVTNRQLDRPYSHSIVAGGFDEMS
jgi:CheY-like chemotaxis protein